MGAICNFNSLTTLTSQEIEIINNLEMLCKTSVSEINNNFEVSCNTKNLGALDTLNYMNNTFEILWNSTSRLTKDFLQAGCSDVEKVFVDFLYGNSLY